MTTQPTNTCDYDPNALPPEQARQRILTHVPVVPDSEVVDLAHALGRVLAAPIYAPFDVPPHANAAMDGYAVAGADLPTSGERVFTLQGVAWAGRPYTETVQPGACVRIMTGAVVPDGCDTVLMQEQVQRVDDHIVVSSGHRRGDHVRAAGEDIAKGLCVLAAGRRLTPADIGLLASLGLAEVRVTRRLRVAFFSSGDELRQAGETLDLGAIYDSNGPTLRALLQQLGAGVELIDLGIVRDRAEDFQAAFQRAADCADVLISSGGASVGDADLVLETLHALGQVEFWKISIKPGRPFAFGRLGETVYFGLSGNPVSAMVGFYQFIQPALHAMQGAPAPDIWTFPARTQQRLKKRPGRVEYQRGQLSRTADGQWSVRSTGDQGAGILTSMSAADCFIILPADSGAVEAGAWVEVQPFFSL